MVQKPTWSFIEKVRREFFVSRVWGPPSSIMHIFPNDGPPREHRAFSWFSPPAREWRDCCEIRRSAVLLAGLRASACPTRCV
ncbi:hypothetical protein GSI_12844 [Ganoderma sinense ZZ0214-1]|uniref:Uncharacterized protein n=1 Tax=Ganoderma sinense ZZ0214-1 TaxID=1077348 RepID=A0A2G8RTV6_9APHY|nr:hypothetical protein GSI_12844 [Ganoderma sinense ZZ0214-1]